jgi:spore germination protein GerM
VPAVSVIPVRFATVDTIDVTAFLHDRDGVLVSVTRSAPRTTGILRASVGALLAGPTDAERERGLATSLPDWLEGPDRVLGVTLSEGVAVVDLDGSASGAGAGVPDAAPTAAARIIAQLNATVFQFETVASVRYELDGSCDRFDSWLGLGCEFGRPD